MSKDILPKEWHTIDMGGGCTASRYVLPDDSYVLITNASGTSHEWQPNDCQVCCYDTSGNLVYKTNE